MAGRFLENWKHHRRWFSPLLKITLKCKSATIFISHSQTSEWSKLYQTQFTSSEVVKYGVPARLKKTILAIYPKCMHCSQGTSKCLETYPQKTQTILLISSRYRDTCWSQYQYRFFKLESLNMSLSWNFIVLCSKSLSISLSIVRLSGISLSLSIENCDFQVSVSVSVSKILISKSQSQSQYRNKSFQSLSLSIELKNMVSSVSGVYGYNNNVSILHFRHDSCFDVLNSESDFEREKMGSRRGSATGQWARHRHHTLNSPQKTLTFASFWQNFPKFSEFPILFYTFWHS